MHPRIEKARFFGRSTIILERGQLVALLIAFGSLLLSVIFVWFRVTGPSDGARLASLRSNTTPKGVVVEPFGEGTSNFQAGDVIVALDGQPMETWANNLFRPRTWGHKWQIGESVTYTMLRDGAQNSLPIQIERYPIRRVLSTHWGPILFALISQIVATVVMVYRPGERASQVLFIWAWSGSHTYAWSLGQQINDLAHGFGFWFYAIFTPALWLLYWCAMLHFALIYPQKNPLVQRFPKFIPGIYVIPYAFFFTFLALTWVRSPSILDWLEAWRIIPDLVPPIYLAATLFFVLWGYFRIYDPVSRRKVRWLVYGVCISGGGGLILWNLPPMLIGRDLISANALGLLTIPFPITLAIAILRHQLFDIDLLINRTLVYGILSGTLALIYFSSVVLFQNMFQALTGDTSQIAIVASTLGIATIFSPLRRRVQNFIDQRFYRQKYDAEQTLSSFARSLSEEVDLETLQSRLIAVVNQTMHPEFTNLWLRKPAGDH